MIIATEQAALLRASIMSFWAETFYLQGLVSLLKEVLIYCSNFDNTFFVFFFTLCEAALHIDFYYY